MGKAQTKGKVGERAVAEKLRPLDPTAKRNLTECREAGLDIETVLPLGIQVKTWARWFKSPHAVLAQAKEYTPEGRIPVAVVKITHKEPMLAVLNFDDFLELVKAYVSQENRRSTSES